MIDPTTTPWLRALHSYAVGWLEVQPEYVRDALAPRFATCEALAGALLAGAVGLQTVADDDAVRLYVLVVDDEGTAHPFGGVNGAGIGLPTAEAFAEAFASVGWDVSAQAACPDDASELLEGDR